MPDVLAPPSRPTRRTRQNLVGHTTLDFRTLSRLRKRILRYPRTHSCCKALSMRSSAILAIALALAPALLATVVDAQGVTFAFDPTSVSLADRNAWCKEAEGTCSTLCQAHTIQNDCSTDTLAQSCQCSYYETPDLALYTGSMQSLKCQRTYMECFNDNKLDGGKQVECQSDIMDNCPSSDPDGYQPPVRVTAASSTQARVSTTTATDKVPTRTGQAGETIPVGDSTSTTLSPVSTPTSEAPISHLPLLTSRSTPTPGSTGAPQPSTTTPSTTTPSSTPPPPTSQPSASLTHTSPPAAAYTGRAPRTIASSVGTWVGISVGATAASLLALFLGLRYRRKAAEKQAAADARSVRSNRGSMIMLPGMATHNGLSYQRADVVAEAAAAAEEQEKKEQPLAESGVQDGLGPGEYGYPRTAEMGEGRPPLRSALNELA
ncbi:uncharacterized protein L3040_001622 [Drepanopeziza brunnea f. sp. 'multigermtubi']|uniref:uncharacterized protein n=1 Tax=Drepanopeziza brunnea f. sp. 'multigermtubi' TaxID=698441 RepID=UPI00238B16A3|nr:hypothetical protein L3040_001622 [Drepanopeziza brunnea f. sp. 'multigermtubi']